MIRYTIKLRKSEVEELTNIINKGAHTSQTFRAAYILLNCDKGEFSKNQHVKNAEICNVLKIGSRTIDRVKKKFIEEGFESVLSRKTSGRTYPKKIDGDLEAKLIALCCSQAPEGYVRWTVRLLADKMVELEYIESISHVAIWGVLKKTNLNLGK